MTNPRLVAVAGPLQGSVIFLTGEEVSIGRGEENEVSLPSTYVSRRHCLVEAAEGRFRIRDLDSTNGTVVNDLPVKEKWLAHGDRLRIGDSLFLFLARDEQEAVTSRSIELGAGDASPGDTAELGSEEVAEVQRRGASTEPGSPQRFARHLSALFKVGSAIASTRGAEALQRRLLQAALEVFSADCGALLFKAEGSDEIDSAVGMERGSEESRQVHVGPGLVRRVVREGVAILTHDVPEGTEPEEDRKAPPPGTGSALVVPLSTPDSRLGAIYVETSDPELRFEAWDLELLTAIAGIAAVALQNARHLDRVEGENRHLRAEIEVSHAMVGDSPAMKEVHAFISRLAATDSTVLITGESGTGKELVVRAIHDNSRRAGAPFVAVNCAALVDSLLESELFGHEKGAFTGAVAQKKGRFEVAHGGTFFLDEVSELSPGLQAKLLRVLEVRQFERVGGTRPIQCDIRVMAATNRDLREEVRAGRFREDLYHRLNVVSFGMRPLRERSEDIPLLANYFAVKNGIACNRKVWGVSDEALACLARYSWPGNIRELQNAIERAVVMGANELIMPEDLPDTVLEWQSADEPALTPFHGAVRDTKKELVLRAFKDGNGSFVETARLLGIHPNSLHRLVRNLNLRAAIKESQ